MTDPLISVVMATHQGDDERHLREAVDSILKQDYPALDFVIVVDGSIDAGRRQYLDGLGFGVKVIYSAVNRGAAYARNLGIDAASGDYIAIMDADDVAVGDRLRRQLEFVVNRKADLVSSYLLVIDSEGNGIGVRKVPEGPTHIKELAPFRCPLHNPSAFGRSWVFKKYRYDERLRVSEDYDLWVRALNDGLCLDNMDYACVRYRQTREATTKRLGLRYALSDLRVKFRALSLVPLHMKPVALMIAVGASFIRLLPPSLFAPLYALRISDVK